MFKVSNVHVNPAESYESDSLECLSTLRLLTLQPMSATGGLDVELLRRAGGRVARRRVTPVARRRRMLAGTRRSAGTRRKEVRFAAGRCRVRLLQQ